MRILEMAALAAALFAAGIFILAPTAPTIIWVFIEIAALGAAMVINPFRWQMAPAFIAILFLVLFGLQASREDMWLPIAALPLLLIAGFLADGFRVRNLPAPRGEFGVGVVSSDLHRQIVSEDGTTRTRRLYVRVWYPAIPDHSSGKRDFLWSDFHSMEDAPALARSLLAYLKGVKTHSWLEAPIRTGSNPYPVIIYNHALVSWASDNSFLLEDLASRGYVAISIRHLDQTEEYRRVQSSLPDKERKHDRKIQAALRKTTSRAERARLSEELFQNSSGAAAIVHWRADDSSFVMDNLAELLSTIPGVDVANDIGREQFGAIGLSLGGAVATRLCAHDRRCAAVVNLDGGLFGLDAAQPAPHPYLMIYSGANIGGNDSLRDRLGDEYSEIVLPNAKHMDLHDAAAALPILRWAGVLSHSDGRELNQKISAIVADFFHDVLN